MLVIENQLSRSRARPANPFGDDMKQTHWILIAFMTVSLIMALYHPTAGAVALFAVASILFAFQTYLERKRFEEIDGIKGDIHNLQQQLSNIKIGLGW